MGVDGGKLMAVDGEKTVYGWKIKYDGNLADYVASNTQGGAGRKSGNKDWIGYYDMYSDQDTPYAAIRFPGDSFTLKATTTTAKGFEGTARCTRLVCTWDVENGRYIHYRVYFGANGALTVGATAATDVTTPCPQNAKGMYVALDDTQEDQCHYMRLDMRQNCKRYCSAEANGQYLRTAGDRMDVEGVWRVYEDTPANLPVMHAMHVVKFYVDGSNTWAITWMRIDGIEAGIDRENDRVPTTTEITARFNAHNGTTIGSIVNPASATKWP
jgi:hypothetical protein